METKIIKKVKPALRGVIETMGRDLDYDLPETMIQVHPSARVSDNAVFVLKQGSPIIVGAGCVIRAGCTLYHGVILAEEVQLGHDVFIREHVTVGAGTSIGTKTIVEWKAVIGNHVKIQGGVFISEGTIIHNYAFIGPHVVTTSDVRMDGAAYKDGVPLTPVVIERGARIGANTVILPNVHVGRDALVAAGVVVSRDVGAGMYVTVDGRQFKLASR